MFPRTFAPAALLLALTASTTWADDSADFFEKKVRPILAERCYECHSPDKKVKGGLRLDSREGWAEGGDSGPAIVPGEPDKSIFIEAIRWGNLDLQMPPKKKLTADELAVLEKWVKMGAPDPRTGATVAKKQSGMSLEDGRKFWCYKQVEKPAVPEVKTSDWAWDDIDRFVLAKLETAGLKPSANASPEALARRLYFNLIGLPPSPEQIDAFAKDCETGRAAATERLVDSLLASPHFGERWGRHWLDVSRFAESSGGGRTLLFKDAWRFRDYVIESFNADVPFDRFIREQIAGDLLPAETPADRRRQLTATAFLALGPTNYEEQDKQQLRYDVIDEQMETIGRTLLGQTIGCARCHDHKFDPISQRDYYAMAGIFASTRTLANYEDNVARWISVPLPGSGEQERALKEHEAKVTAADAELKKANAALAAAMKSLSAPTAEPGMPIAPGDLPGIVIDDSEAKVVGEWTHSTHVRSYIGKGYLHDANDGKGEKTITFTPSIPESGKYEVRLAYAHADGRANNIRVTVLHADGEENVFVDQTVVPPIDGRFVSLGKFRFEKDGAGYVLITNDATKGYVTVDGLQLIPADDKKAATVAKADPKADPAAAEARQKVKQLEAELKKLKAAGPVRETTMAVRDDDEIADAQIRVRGIEKQRGDKVARGFIRVAQSSQDSILGEHESGRRELAEWIVSPANPLTARVFVNRVWGWLFGAGLVRTVDNFGTTGETPSHPELLDYLADKFVQQGWSPKQLIREIVLSRTWQQEVSKPTAQDPENRLLAHANRRRLDAEQIRDAMLFVSGQLDLQIGGLTIKGAGDIDANNFSAQDVEYGYVYADKRRSVYTPAFRNKRLELFEVFDFGDINQPVGQRNVSTVAPQALFLLNHPFVLEQATAAAERTRSASAQDEARVVNAFRWTLGRAPTAGEFEKCRQYIATSSNPVEGWSQLHQMLFACLDFRYLE
jgi:hypothetical protein